MFSFRYHYFFFGMSCIGGDRCTEAEPNFEAYSSTEEPRNKASASRENPPLTTRTCSLQMLFLFILYIGNKASLSIRHEINWLKCAIAGFLCSSFRIIFADIVGIITHYHRSDEWLRESSITRIRCLIGYRRTSF